MKWRLILAGAVFVIFGIPLLAINLGALGMQAKVENALNGETSVPGPIADAGGHVVDIWGTFREDREIDALFVADRFTRRRSIRLSETVTIADMLGEGDAAPGPGLEELWVHAHAPQWALERECPVVLETIGRACAVSTAMAEPTSEPGTYRIEAVLGYLPDHDLGDTAIDGPRDLYRARVRLPGKGGLFALPAARDTATRRLYREAETACDALRESRGNCVLADLEISAGGPDTEGRVPYHLTASLYTVAPKDTRPAGEDLVGSYGSTFAEETGGLAERLGLGAGLAFLFGGGGQTASAGDSPSILRGGHQRYGGNDGRFIAAPDP